MLEVKDFLMQPKKLDLLIHNKLIERQQYHDIAFGITSCNEGSRVSSSGSRSKMADAIDRLVDAETEIDSLVDKMVNTKKKVIAMIEQVDNPTEYNVLHMKYIQYMSLQEIADYYGKEYGWATTTHGRALKSLHNVMKRDLMISNVL